MSRLYWMGIVAWGLMHIAEYGMAGEAKKYPNAATPFNTVPGKAISRDEAQAIAERLHARILPPWGDIESLRAEFTPRFLSVSRLLTADSRMRDHFTFPEDTQFGFFEGLLPYMLHPSYLFRDDGLSRARKAVFYYGRRNRVAAQTRAHAAVLLYDEEGNRLDLHPAIGFNLGTICLMRLVPGNNLPWVHTRHRENRELEWRLHALPNGESKLYSISRQTWKRNVHSELQCVKYRSPDIPLSSSTATWTRQNTWSDSERSEYEFGRLGESDKFAVIRSPFVLKSDWMQIDGTWTVYRSSTSWPPGKQADQGEKMRISFTNFVINPTIPEGVLDLPDAPHVEMKFSTPEAAAETVMTCLKTGRSDLLPYCAVVAPDKPMPTKMSSWLTPYDLEVYGRMRLSDGQKKDDAWFFVLEFRRPFAKRDRKCRIRIVPVDKEWRCETENLAFTVYSD